MRRLLGALLAAALVLGLPGVRGTARAEEPIAIVIDGRVQSLAKAPVIINGTTLVPVRGLFENLGGQVLWDPVNQTVTVVRDSSSVILTVGQERATINGKSVTLAVPPQIIDGSTMVPLRVISEALGAEVHWQASSRTVDMTTRIGGTMTIAQLEPNSLFPLQNPHDAINLIYDALLRLDNQALLHPSLARSYQISDDGRVYTFELQPEVTWHDGKPFTAADVAYTFQTLMHADFFTDGLMPLKGATALRSTYHYVAEGKRGGQIQPDLAVAMQDSAWRTWMATEAIQVVDSDTIRFTLESPNAPFLTNLGTQLILPAHLAPPSGPSGLRTSPQATQPVGTGAYKFASWEAGKALRLVRNPEWRLGVTGVRPRIAEIRFQFLSADAAAATVNSGLADLGQVSGLALASLPQYKNLKIASFPLPSYAFLGYNLKDPRFADVRVRQAITHAIDREAMVKALFGKYGEVQHSHQLAGSWYNTDDLPRFHYDPARAGALLDEAGWKMGPNGLRERDGVPLRFEIATNSGVPHREQTAVMIQTALKQIGIDAQVTLMEWNAFLEYIDSDRKQAYVLGWSLTPDPDSYIMFHSQGAYQAMSGINNAEIDRLVAEGRITSDPVKRQPIYQRFQQVVAEQQIYTWLYVGHRAVVRSARVQGISSEMMGALDPFWNIETWYIDETAR